LGPKELTNYVAAYDAEPLSIRNEWHLYSFLKEALDLRKMELQRNVKRYQATPGGLSHRSMTVLAIRERDLEVVTAAGDVCARRLQDLSGLLHFSGATATREALRRSNVVLQQFQALKKAGSWNAIRRNPVAVNGAPPLHPSPLEAPATDAAQARLELLRQCLLSRRQHSGNQNPKHSDPADK
jgi:hypothetical protein